MRFDRLRFPLALGALLALSLVAACAADDPDDPAAGGGGTGGGSAAGGTGGGGTGGGGGVDPYEVRESAEVAAYRASTGVTFTECGVTTRICGEGGCTAPACDGEDEAYECLQQAFSACTAAHLQDRYFPFAGSRTTTDFFVVPTDSACELVAIWDTREAMMDCVSLDRYTCPVWAVTDCALNRSATCTVESLLDDPADC
jgi:hypothetical protein